MVQQLGHLFRLVPHHRDYYDRHEVHEEQVSDDSLLEAALQIPDYLQAIQRHKVHIELAQEGGQSERQRVRIGGKR